MFHNCASPDLNIGDNYLLNITFTTGGSSLNEEKIIARPLLLQCTFLICLTDFVKLFTQYFSFI